MNIYKKNKLLKFLCLILITTLLILTTYFFVSKNPDSKITFKNFMDSYKSKNIVDANKYLIDKQIPNINDIFNANIENSNDTIQTEIINLFMDLLYSIEYDIISSKTFFNKSTLNVNFNYYNLSRHIINFFKNTNSQETNYEDFMNSLKTTKYKISTNLNINLIKKNKQWYILLSEGLINILTSGIYKNFVI